MGCLKFNHGIALGVISKLNLPPWSVNFKSKFVLCHLVTVCPMSSFKSFIFSFILRPIFVLFVLRCEYRLSFFLIMWVVLFVYF